MVTKFSTQKLIFTISDQRWHICCYLFQKFYIMNCSWIAEVVFKKYIINSLGFQEPHICEHMIMWLCLWDGGFQHMRLLPVCHSIIFMTICVSKESSTSPVWFQGCEVYRRERQNHVFGKWDSGCRFISKMYWGFNSHCSLMIWSIPY